MTLASGIVSQLNGASPKAGDREASLRLMVDASVSYGSSGGGVFDRSGALFITQGDRFDYRDQAQNLSSGLGKIVRVLPDGSIPGNNPFAGRSDARPEIWSYGHRNIQAAALDPGTGQLWTVEHGARGGDELNHPEAGKNYGWPVITYGRDYSGLAIGEGTTKEGMEQPVYYWDPVIAPSGMTFYTGDAYPGWKGSAFVGSLTPGQLVRITLRDGKVEREERYLDDLGERQIDDAYLGSTDHEPVACDLIARGTEPVAVHRRRGDHRMRLAPRLPLHQVAAETIVQFGG